MNQLYVAMVVKNEEEFINLAISSIEEIATRIIVVDTGSVDATCSKVRSYDKCDLYHRDFPKNYGSGRNIPIDIIKEDYSDDSKDYILSLDGDEIITSPKKIIRAINDNNFDAYYLVKNHLVPGGWFSNLSLRLFRNIPELQYSGSICELMEPRINQIHGSVNTINAVINDMGFRKESKIVRNKIEHYIKLLKEKIESENQIADYYYLSYYQTLNGDILSAFDTLDRIFERIHDPFIDLQKAYSFVFLGDLDRAERILLEHLKENDVDIDNFAEIMNKLGQIYSRRGNFGKAIQYYSEAHHSRPERDVYLFNLFLMDYLVDSNIDSGLKKKANRRNPLIKEIKFESAQLPINSFNELDARYPNVQELLWGETNAI